MDVPQLLLIGAASVGAGAINAAAGGGTLITFPAMLAAGMSPIAANVTSTIGIYPGTLGGSWSYRREVVVQRRRLIANLPWAVAGSIGGAALLLLTPPDSFETIVPYLVLLAGLLFAAQPLLQRWLRGQQASAAFDSDTTGGWPAKVIFCLVGVYGSYFGAGMGVMMLAVFGLLVHDALQRINGLKNVMAAAVNGVGALIFAFSAHVDWLVVAIMVPASLLGGLAGGWLARRVPTWLLRSIVIAFALAVASTMLWQQHAG